MARQSGPVKIRGTVGDLSFFKSQYGFFVREHNPISKTRLKNDPGFIRVRENMAEFGAAASAAKMIRQSFASAIDVPKDNRVVWRLTQLMSEIKNLDTTSVRGLRRVEIALANPNAKQLLKGFNFNSKAQLETILSKAVVVNSVTGIITINNFVPAVDLSFPMDATHVAISGAWAKIDFASGTKEVESTNKVNLQLDGNGSNLVLTPANLPTGIGTSVFALMVEYFQDVNGQKYKLQNDAYSTCAIIEVD